MPFREITGHDRLVELLSRSIHRGSLPPSLIFAGPPGHDKRRVAVAVAQAINCDAPVVTRDHTDACGDCASCRRIARAVHPDVTLVEPGDGGSIKVEQIREVVERTGYKPFEGRRRVVIIDSADLMVPAAQNALLKTLEEPPSSLLLVLVTSRPDMLLPTVHSRCIRLGVAEAIVESLDPGRYDAAERTLTQAAGTSDPRRRIDAAKELLAKAAGEAGRSDCEQLGETLRAMETVLRDVALLAACETTRALANPDRRERIDRLRRVYGGERGARAFLAVDRALAALERHNAGAKVVADWVVLQL
jgi:DNA polymerase-3 subunit delta'